MTDADKLTEYEGVIRLLTAKCEELAAANEALKADLTAHQTLKAIYADPNQPATVRVRAAQAALSRESAPLKPVEAPLDLVGEEIVPLAELVEQRRKRHNELQGQQIEVVPDPSAPYGVRTNVLPKLDGNGDGNDH